MNMKTVSEMIEYLEQDNFTLGKEELDNIVFLLKNLEELNSRKQTLKSIKEVGYLNSTDIQDFNLTDYVVKELVYSIADHILKNKLYKFRITEDEALQGMIYRCELDVLKPDA